MREAEVATITSVDGTYIISAKKREPTMDIRLDTGDFKEALEGFAVSIAETQDFIHSELEQIEMKYSEQKDMTEKLREKSLILSNTIESLSSNIKFFLEKLEARIDAEVYERTQLAVRLEGRLSFLEFEQNQMKTFASDMYNDMRKLINELEGGK